MLRRYCLIILLGALGLSGLFQNPPARAQTPTGLAQFLEVSPARNELTLLKDIPVTREVKVTNKHVSTIRLKVAFDNILPNGVNGETRPVEEATPYDLQRFATLPVTSVELKPGESRTVAVTLRITGNTAPGGYYGMVRFSPQERTDLPPVAIQGEIGSLFLVRLPGQAKEGGTIKELNITASDGQRVGPFFIGRDLFLTSLVTNSGTVHFATAPKFTAKNQFDRQSFEAATEARNIFPQSDRKFEVRWAKAGLGRHSVTAQTAIPGQGSVSLSKTVIVIPPLIGAVGLAVLGLLLVILIWRWRRRRRQRRHSSEHPTL